MLINVVAMAVFEMTRLKSESLYIHSRDTATLAYGIVKALKAINNGNGAHLPDPDIIKVAGMVHDIGKLSVPDEIINKKGKLNEREMELIMLHPLKGYEAIISMFTAHLRTNSDYQRRVQEIAIAVRHHHELPNGKGYPDGITDKQIPLSSKILGIADKACALSEERSYRPSVFPREYIIKNVFYDIDWGFSGEDINTIANHIDAFLRSPYRFHHTEQSSVEEKNPDGLGMFTYFSQEPGGEVKSA